MQQALQDLRGVLVERGQPERLVPQDQRVQPEQVVLRVLPVSLDRPAQRELPESLESRVSLVPRVLPEPREPSE